MEPVAVLQSFLLTSNSCPVFHY